MRIKTLTWRILKQLLHDKRTTAIILIAPILILTMMYFILNTDDTNYTIGVFAQESDPFVQKLKKTDNVKVVELEGLDIQQPVQEGSVMACVKVSNDDKEISLYLDGSNITHAQKIQAIVKSTAYNISSENLKKTLRGKGINISDSNIKTEYVYGKEDSSLFDQFGASLIGIMVYFFSFLIAGINFLGERSTGTMEKLLSTPIRRTEIIVGYVLGFSLLALIQTAIISTYTVYVLGLQVAGNIGYVFVINLLTAITALTFGILLSTLAGSEFQMIQFIPIVIVPQIFLCGLFDLSGFWDKISYVMPLRYTSKALSEVILKGNGIESIWKDMTILIAFSVITILCNIRYLSKQRAI
jgi:ABC-2 type transport system permease protein